MSLSHPFSPNYQLTKSDKVTFLFQNSVDTNHAESTCKMMDLEHLLTPEGKIRLLEQELTYKDQIIKYLKKLCPWATAKVIKTDTSFFGVSLGFSL